MTALKGRDIDRFLSRPDLDEGVVLVYGPDAGLVRENAALLISAFRKALGQGTEVITLDGAELDADPSRLAVEARTGSLFGDRRVIRLRAGGRSLVPSLSIIADDPGGAVIIVEGGDLKPRDALRALAETGRNARALPCYADSEEAVGNLVRETFAKAGIRAEADVFALLRDLLGNDREVTRRELEKLVLYAAEAKEVTRDAVLALLADNAALVVDEVIDAAGSGHIEKLEQALSRALAAHVDAQRVLAVANAHFSLLRRWRVEVDAGKSARDVIANARPRPHFSRASGLEQQLRAWSDGKLAAALERLRLATVETRLHPRMGEALLRRTFLSLARLAAG